MISIPEPLARDHGREKAAAIGAKWAETFCQFGLTGSSRVLDIGCGPGRMAIAIGERFNWSNDYFGFDVRKRDIRFCRTTISREHRNFRFAHVNARNQLYNPSGRIEPQTIRFPVKREQFDFAFATSVFTHMYTGAVAHYAEEVAATMKGGGIFLSTWFLLDEEAEERIARGKSRFRFNHPAAEGVRADNAIVPEEGLAFTASSALSILKKAGFENLLVVKGTWAGPREARHSQDIILAHKPAASKKVSRLDGFAQSRLGRLAALMSG